MRVAVVGHVEWVEFVEVDRVPAPGQIAHGSDSWAEPAGGGAVVAAQLVKLAGACDFYTALGEDEHGRRSVERLEELGMTLHVQWFGQTRRALTHVDQARERTITTVGAKLRPAGPLPLGGYDGVFFVAGDVAALHSAREARFLAATPRELETLLEGGVRIDLLVGSGTDPGERYEGGLDVTVVCTTEGQRGGIAGGERYAAASLPGPLVDTYGAGDSFAAALFFGLARGDVLPEALELAARAGAAVTTGKGPYTAQITL
ncbi:MAG TPA: PfkB family carbohydrate kinase [Gaiellaceae bacterium]|nr:PfkB family carbohydrate kinase [Gaiellaceae bacterium]